MANRMNSARYQLGDLLRVEIAGIWVDGEYVGHVQHMGHIIRTAARVETVGDRDDRIRRRGGDADAG